MPGSCQIWMRSMTGWMALSLAVAITGCTGYTNPPSTETAPLGAINTLQPDQVEVWRVNHPGALLLDVRELTEQDDVLGALDGAVAIPIGELQVRKDELAIYKDKGVLVYDRIGTRAREGAQILVNDGFRDVSYLDGGLVAYRALFPR